MKSFGLNLVEGSNISNLTVPSGAATPANPSLGELFYLDSNDSSEGLYFYNGTSWAPTISTASLDSTYVNAAGDTMSGSLTINSTLAVTGTSTLNGVVNAGGAITAGNYVFRALSDTGDRLRIASLAAGSGAMIDVTNAAENTTARPLNLGASNGTVILGGNVGINATPTYRLDISGANGNGVRYTGGTGQVFVGETSNLPAIGSISNHALLFLSNSAERMRLDASGNLGIATTPTYRLDISATPVDTSAVPTVRVGAFREFYMQPGTGGSAIYGPVLGFGGYVNTNTDTFTKPAATNMNGMSAIAGAYAGDIEFYAYNAGTTSLTNTGLAASKRMTITGAGLVLVNRTTDSTYGLLQVNSAAAQVADFAGTGGAYVNVRVGASAIAGVRIAGNGTTPGTGSFDLQQDSTSSVDIVNRSNARMSFYTNALERMRINAGGSVVISSSGAVVNVLSGASSFSPGLQVNGTIVNTSSMLVSRYNNDTSGGTLFGAKSRGTALNTFTAVTAGDSLLTLIANGADGTQFVEGARISFDVDGTVSTSNVPSRIVFYTNAASGGPSIGAERMRIDSSGNVLFGTTSTGGNGFKVLIDGTGAYAQSRRNSAGTTTHIEFANTNGVVGSITTNGSATAYNTTSDVRLKTNIVPAASAGSKIDAIQIRAYDFITGGHVDYGVIAQELVTVAPEAVTVGADDATEKPWAVDYSKLVPLLVKEIQELRARVAALEA